MICKKIGIDFHGVINTDACFFKQFCDFAKSYGFEVHIISGGPRELIEEFLNLHNIYHTVIWCIFDYFKAKNEVVFLPDGSFHVEDEAWNSAKGKYCSQNNISVQIDDSRVYGKYFTTPYCFYNECTKQGVLKGEVVDFSLPISDCFYKILSLLKKD